MGASVTISRLVNRNVVAGRGRTSMRLEPELWDALLEIADREGRDVSTLVRQVEETRHEGGRTSAVRVFILAYFRAAATEHGHTAASHGSLSRRPDAEAGSTLGTLLGEPEAPRAGVGVNGISASTRPAFTRSVA